MFPFDHRLSSGRLPGKYYAETHGTVQFSRDFLSNRVFTSTEAGEAGWHDESGEARPVGPAIGAAFSQRAVVTADEILWFEPEISYGPTTDDQARLTDGAAGRMAFKDPYTRGRVGLRGAIVDPHSLFQVPGYPGRLSAYMEEAASILDARGRGIDGQRRRLYEVMREEGRHRCLLVWPAKSRNALAFFETEIDVGDFVAISARRTREGDKVLESWEFEWGIQDGIAVPKSMRFSLFDPKNGALKFSRALRLTESRLNVTIPEHSCPN